MHYYCKHYEIMSSYIMIGVSPGTKMDKRPTCARNRYCLCSKCLGSKAWVGLDIIPHFSEVMVQ